MKTKYQKTKEAPKPPEGGLKKRPAVKNSADKLLYAKLREKAEEMRKRPTEAENKLWEFLQDNKLGFKFRRQHVINKFIVDFYCVPKALVVEVDGIVHNFQKAHDWERDDILKNLGCKVLHFSNSKVLKHVDLVIETILNTLKEPRCKPNGECICCRELLGGPPVGNEVW